MSFLDHLDELRRRLIRSALFIGIAFVVCWIFSKEIYNFIQVPVRAAMLEAKREFAPALGGTALALSDLPDGTDVTFPLPIDAKLGDVLIAAGNTVPAKVKRLPDGSLQVVTSSYWMIDDRTVIEKDTVIPPALYQSSS
ncbi:MAG: twin-arginine translocase subunit TatC, partial [Blastocatellia bacterium]